jgi:hypothetical protein
MDDSRFAACMAQFFLFLSSHETNDWARELRRRSNEIYYSNNKWKKKMFLFTICAKKNCRVTLTIKFDWFFFFSLVRESSKAGMLTDS